MDKSVLIFVHGLCLRRLSVFLENADPSRKKHPVNNLEVLTLSYKVGRVQAGFTGRCQHLREQELF